MSNINILNRNWMLPEERELAAETARNEPNTCVNRFTERLNRMEARKTTPLSVNAAKEEIKLGGGLRDGKLRGYSVPKEKDILRFLKSKGAQIMEDDFKKKVPEQEHPEFSPTVEEKIYNEVTENVVDVESSPEAEERMKLSNMAYAILVCLKSCGYRIRGVISTIKKDVHCGHRKIQNGMRELVDNQICREIGKKSYDLNLTPDEIEDFYPSLKKELWYDYKFNLMSPRSKRMIKKQEIANKDHTVIMPSTASICEWLDEGDCEYNHWNLAKKFNIPNEEAFRIECQLLKDGYLTKVNARTSQEKVVPTFCWQQKKKEEKKEVFKNFQEIPSSTNPLEFPKDIVFKNSNIRIVNESGKELDIIVRSTEIIVKIK